MDCNDKIKQLILGRESRLRSVIAVTVLGEGRARPPPSSGLPHPSRCSKGGQGISVLYGNIIRCIIALYGQAHRELPHRRR